MSMPLRANLKLQLMRAQMAEEDRREQMTLSQSYKPVSKVIQMPVSNDVSSSEVPAQVLRVRM